MPNALIVATVLGYTLTTVLLLTRWDASKPTEKCALPLALWGITLILHAILLSSTLYTADGIDLSLPNALSMVGWTTSAILLGTALRYPVTSLGTIILPAAALVVLSGWLVPHNADTIIRASKGLQIHIITSVLAYSVLTLAAVQAILLAYQDAHLRRHQLKGWVRRLPPLQHMEMLLFQIIWTGFLLLTLSLTSGFLYVDDLFSQQLVHKTVLSMAAWAMFGTLLAGRQLVGWRGRRAMRWTLSGFILLMLGYFGSKLVIELLLQTS